MADITEVADGPGSFFRRIRKGVTESVVRPLPGGVRVTRAPDISQTVLGSKATGNSTSSNSSNSSSTPAPKYYRLEQFNNILGADNIDLTQLRKLSWNGVPPQYRTMVWQLLLEYLPTNKRSESLSTLFQRSQWHTKEESLPNTTCPSQRFLTLHYFFFRMFPSLLPFELIFQLIEAAESTQFLGKEKNTLTRFLCSLMCPNLIGLLRREKLYGLFPYASCDCVLY
jgi:hypothetical protein